MLGAVLLMQRFYVIYSFCNIRLLPESGCYIHVLIASNRIEFLLA